MILTTFIMPWWGWVLIGVAIIALGLLKLFVFNKISAKRKAAKKAIDEQKED